jgi:hypothetical protein
MANSVFRPGNHTMAAPKTPFGPWLSQMWNLNFSGTIRAAENKDLCLLTYAFLHQPE